MKDQLKYFKQKIKKIHKTNENIVNVLFQVSMAKCCAFIKDKSFLLAHLLQLALDSSKEEMDIQPSNEIQHVDEVILKFV